MTESAPNNLSPAIAKIGGYLPESLLKKVKPRRPVPTYNVVGWIFLRLLGIIYLTAFFSLATQIVGLVGTNGILPAAKLMSMISEANGQNSFFIFPTLAWFNAGDLFLRGICIAGGAASIFAALGILTGPSLLICWVLWLSLVTVGQEFLSFQWDILLLEAGFLAVFFAPWCIAEPPWKLAKFTARLAPFSPVLIWLYRWLLFRLMFESGYVKLRSGDPTWANFTALDYHYWTQPLPTPLAYFAAKLPEWFHKMSVGGVFIIELILPIFIFAPRPMRLIAASGIVLLQILIALTGNYAYFNLLTIALCLFLVDDQLLQKIVPAPVFEQLRRMAPLRFPTLRKVLTAALAGFIALLSIINLLGESSFPESFHLIAAKLEPYRFVNSYGLFAVMTTSRLEIIVEGSNDGVKWLPYEFRYKPGDLKRAPCIVAPCQPRLDWQMWFAALGNFRQSPWFARFLLSLFQGSPDVLALLEKNPFPQAPPKYLRAQLYSYTFSNTKTLLSTGAWWRRQYAGPFMPPVSK